MAGSGHHAVMTIEDDGIGLPVSGESGNPGFGLQFVELMAEQIDGVLTREAGHGTRLRLEFDME